VCGCGVVGTKTWADLVGTETGQAAVNYQK
jgi:hypothetical protein